MVTTWTRKTTIDRKIKKNRKKDLQLFIIKQTVRKKKKKKLVTKKDQIKKHFYDDYYVSEKKMKSQDGKNIRKKLPE